MRVCIITSVHPLYDTRIFYKQANSLVHNGYNVTIIAQHDITENIDGIEVVPIPITRSRLLRPCNIFRVLILALKQRAGIYHFHDPELLLVIPFIKIFTRGKIIYDVHENVRYAILSKNWIPRVLRKPASICYRLIEFLTFPFIDRVILAEDSYLKSYGSGSRIAVIRNYQILPFISSPREYISQPDIIYVGGITEGRGILEILESIKLLKDKYKDIKLTLVGPIYSDKFRKRMDSLINKYGITNNVEFTGRIKHELVYDIISQNSIGLSILHPEPNYIDSLPTKLFEYMLCGRPVIVSDFPLWKDIVDSNKCGLAVDPLSPGDIAAAIKYLLDHSDEARQMGENGRKAVIEKYNWENESKKLISTYQGLLRVK
jgi:glycosyltransferase involved in cell wall biosynthesis